MATNHQTKRRSRARLEDAVRRARNAAELAAAHYELALFHDNNGREAEAVPHYEAAVEHGLSGEKRAECLAWLASSLHKTDRPHEAMERLTEARELTSNRDLLRSLHDLGTGNRGTLAMRAATKTRR